MRQRRFVLLYLACLLLLLVGGNGCYYRAQYYEKDCVQLYGPHTDNGYAYNQVFIGKPSCPYEGYPVIRIRLHGKDISLSEIRPQMFDALSISRFEITSDDEWRGWGPQYSKVAVGPYRLVFLDDRVVQLQVYGGAGAMIGVGENGMLERLPLSHGQALKLFGQGGRVEAVVEMRPL